jgi:hypothetical protein
VEEVGGAGLALFGIQPAWKKDRKLHTYGDRPGWLILVGQNREREEEKKENLFFFFKAIKSKFPNLLEIK